MVEKDDNVKEISFCALIEADSLKLFLKSLSKRYSTNLIKSYLNAKQRQKKVNKGEQLWLPLNLINHLEINPEYSGAVIHIIYEDQNLIVLDKPPGVHCHPLTYTDQNNCLSWLRQHGHNLTTNEDHYDRGLLNRLDSETSGVLIYFKNSHYHQQARDNFQTMVIKKIYLAKVFGACPLLGRLQDHLIISDQKVSVDTDGEAHSVLAQLEILSSNYDAKTNTSELKIGLMTGVRHQIRVQLGSRGFPIIGDQLYGGHSADRLYLHALLYHLKLAEKILEFHSPVGTSWTRTVLAI